jgi:hypothetical protein
MEINAVFTHYSPTTLMVALDACVRIVTSRSPFLRLTDEGLEVLNNHLVVRIGEAEVNSSIVV